MPTTMPNTTSESIFWRLITICGALLIFFCSLNNDDDDDNESVGPFDSGNNNNGIYSQSVWFQSFDDNDVKVDDVDTADESSNIDEDTDELVYNENKLW